MEELRASPIRGESRNNSSPSVLFPSSARTIALGLASVDSISYEVNRTLFFPEKSLSDIEKLKGQSYDYAYHQRQHSDHTTSSTTTVALRNNTAALAGVTLNDTHLASRRAEEAATRRQQAILWLQEMAENLPLTIDSTVEDLRLCLRNGLILCRVINKVQPGVVPKVVENPLLSNQVDGAQSAYQYFENVRNFLVAVEEMGLPSFEASDLEQGSMSSSSSAKLVDCILALKSYHDWKQGGALGFWRLKSPNHPTGYITNTTKYFNRSKSMNGSNVSRKKWALPDQESLDDNSLTCLSTQPDVSLTSEKDIPAPFSEALQSSPFDQNDISSGIVHDEVAGNGNTSVSKSAWLQHIGHKFREVLQVKTRGIQGVNSALVAAEGYGGGTPTSTTDNAPSQSLLSLINAILGDKTAEEVPMLVEFMLRKVMEEFERHLLTQRKQVMKMRGALKEILVREEKLATQNSVLVTLAAGTQEEIKLYSRMLQNFEVEKRQSEEEKRLRDEEVSSLIKDNKEKQIAVHALKHELDNIKRLDKELLLKFENQKKEFEMECKESIALLELQLQDSYKKMEEMEINAAKEMRSLRLKDIQYQAFVSQQVLDYKDLRLAQVNAKDEVLRMQMQWEHQFKELEKHLQGMARAASGYHKVLAENRILYNEVQDLKGNIRVYCRVRPFLTASPGRLTTVDYIGENGELMLVNPGKNGGKDSRKSFSFNKCFGPNATQEEVFLDTQPLIRSVLDGFNVCIFAYGQTGSGKTFTMSGPNNMSSVDWGVNYRALHDLFHMTQSRHEVFRYEIGVQMLEIYNEQVRDLLAVDGVQKKLEIRNNSQLNGLNVPDASRMSVRSTEDVLELMKVGQKNRAVGATALNERSSRSHSVLTVHVQGTDLDSGAILRGSLHLVDLAGSERVDRSEATGDRLKEAQHINKSLSALGDVISALAQKNAHVPYRNSKLTQLLQDSLGGQAKTLMFVHISPDVESFGETVSTLKFAERVSSVELGAARSNKESGEIQTLKDQVALLKETAAKKDAELASLQVFKERFEKGEFAMAGEKYKSKPAKPSPHFRRTTSDTSGAQRSLTVQNEAGSGITESRQRLRKLPGQPKPSLPLGLSTSHDSEDPTEHFVSSSACSPLSSPTEQKGVFEVLEEGADNINEKLKLLRVHQNGTSAALENDSVLLKTKQGSKQREPQQGEVYEPGIMHTTASCSSPAQEEITIKEWDDRFQHSGEESRSISQDADKHTTFATGGYLSEANVEAEAGRSTGSSQRSLQGISQLKPLFDIASSSQQNSNGYYESAAHEAMPADQHENRGVINKRTSFLLNDVGLEDHFESDGIFDLRDGYDDSASLFSESGLSVEADQSSSSQVDQNKKVQSSFGLPRHERRALLQTQVPRPPVKGARKLSPAMDRKSIAGNPQTRLRRYTNVGVNASTDKLTSKRNVSLGGNLNFDPDSSGNRRVANGASSSTSWR